MYKRIKMYNTHKINRRFSSFIFVEGTASILTFVTIMTLLGY